MHLTFNRVISTPVETKTPSGKSYREIEPELIAPLPAEWHEYKKLGWSKNTGCDLYYGFCPWWRLRQRLRDLVGSSGYRFEIVENYISSDGDPVMIGVLNILGVEHQGIGYGRSHDSYKGGREEIAYADAFKNAAEHHGLGAYLDDQKELVKHLLAAKHPEAKRIADILKIQYIKSNALTKADLKEANQAKSDQVQPDQSTKPQAKPKAKTGGVTGSMPSISSPPVKAGHQETSASVNGSLNSLYPQHNTEIKALRSRLGYSSSQVLMMTNQVEPGMLSMENYDDLVCRLILDWAIANGFYGGNYQAAKEALNNDYKCFCSEQQRDLTMIQAAHLWIDFLKESMAELANV